MANIRKGDLVQVITGQTRERGERHQHAHRHLGSDGGGLLRHSPALVGSFGRQQRPDDHRHQRAGDRNRRRNRIEPGAEVHGRAVIDLAGEPKFVGGLMLDAEASVLEGSRTLFVLKLSAQVK